jgi:hypothetical protein
MLDNLCSKFNASIADVDVTWAFDHGSSFDSRLTAEAASRMRWVIFRGRMIFRIRGVFQKGLKLGDCSPNLILRHRVHLSSARMSLLVSQLH